MALFRDDDEELGKKDDEYKPGVRKVWKQRHLSQLPPRRSLKRIAFAVLGLIAICYLFKNTLGENDDDDRRVRPNNGALLRSKASPSPTVPTKLATPSTMGSVERNFNGPIKFFELASTLHVAGRMGGSSSYNQNVLFAAASLKSATFLLPIACEMAIQERNQVHFAFLGRDDIPIDLLKSVNGITKECKIMFHDARPDFAAQSTNFRMEVSCSAAYNHINTFIHPQATLIDDSGLEEQYFLRGVKDRAASLDKAIIGLPDNVEQSLMWITLLDSASLAAWNKVTIDLLVHAQPSATGSLIRLLESLKRADYFSSTPPRLTIELPHDIDTATKSYLRHRFNWPPNSGPSGGNSLTLHHRIPQRGLTVEENSIRFLESFWPANPSTCHVVVLSPQAELSPLFFHYLKYAVLDYKYSIRQYDSSQLLGISLDSPQVYLNGTTAFKPPLLNGSITPFLWQAPNSNAVLYFGERWVELHDFVSKLLVSQYKLPVPVTLGAKQVSKIYPSWLEHILKLARARGFTTIYPSFESGDSLVTLHTDLYQLPEEHKAALGAEPEGELGADVKQYIKKNKEGRLLSSGLLGFLKDGGKLPLLADIPMVTYDGEIVEWAEMEASTEEFVALFKEEIGGCSEKDEIKLRVSETANDLFCLDDKPKA